MNVAHIVESLRASRGFGHKTDIAGVLSSLGNALPGGMRDLGQAVAVGDDCAAIADHDGYLLFAIEGMVRDFIAARPWFAGYSAVMVNVSDIYAMGGRPLAVVDAIWSDGVAQAAEVLKGMAAASAAYGVPSSAGIAMPAAIRPSLRWPLSGGRGACYRASRRARATGC